MSLWREVVDVRLQLAVGVLEPGGTVAGVWDASLWDAADALWGSSEDDGGGNVAWEDIQCDITRLRVNRGKDSWRAQYDPGSMTATISNLYGDYTPQVPSPNQRVPLRLGRRVRLQFAPKGSGQWTTMFTGQVTSVDERMDSRFANEVRIRAVEHLATFGNVNLAAQDEPVGDGWTADQWIGFVLDEVGWPSELRDLQAGITELAASTFAGRALDEIRMAEVSSGGSVFNDRDGNIVFRNRDWLTSGLPAPVKFYGQPGGGPDGHCADELSYDYTMERVVNRVRLSLGVPGWAEKFSPDWYAPMRDNWGTSGGRIRKYADDSWGIGALLYDPTSSGTWSPSLLPFYNLLRNGDRVRITQVADTSKWVEITLGADSTGGDWTVTAGGLFARGPAQFGPGGTPYAYDANAFVTLTLLPRTVEVDDAVSIAQHGVRTYTRNDLATRDEDDLQWLADRLLANLKDSRERITGLSVDVLPGVDVVPLLALDYGSPVEVNYGHQFGWGFTSLTQVVGCEINLTGDELSLRWRTDDAEVVGSYTADGVRTSTSMTTIGVA